MFGILFKTNNRYKLAKPSNQTAEILFELINKINVSRSELHTLTGVLNVTAIISILRLDWGIDVRCDMKETKNKHGSVVRYGVYRLNPEDKEFVLISYNRINKHK